MEIHLFLIILCSNYCKQKKRKQDKFQLHTNHPPLSHVESDQSHKALKVFCGVASRYQMSRDIFEVQCYTRACVHRSDQSIQWYTVQKIG